MLLEKVKLICGVSAQFLVNSINESYRNSSQQKISIPELLENKDTKVSEKRQKVGRYQIPLKFSVGGNAQLYWAALKTPF